MRKYIVIRFDDVNEGTEYMHSYDYPSAFVVGSSLYDKVGNLTTFEHYLELNIEDIRNVITDEINFMESYICYDGNNLFFDKNYVE